MESEKVASKRYREESQRVWSKEKNQIDREKEQFSAPPDCPPGTFQAGDRCILITKK